MSTVAAATCSPEIARLHLEVGRLGRAYLETGDAALLRESNRLAHIVSAAMYPRNHIRCEVCNPAGNPPPAAGKYQRGPKAARLRGRRRRGYRR